VPFENFYSYSIFIKWAGYTHIFHMPCFSVSSWILTSSICLSGFCHSFLLSSPTKVKLSNEFENIYSKFLPESTKTKKFFTDFINWGKCEDKKDHRRFTQLKKLWKLNLEWDSNLWHVGAAPYQQLLKLCKLLCMIFHVSTLTNY